MLSAYLYRRFEGILYSGAEVQRKDGDLDSADAIADQALLALHKRYNFYSHLQSDQSSLIPSQYRSSPDFIQTSLHLERLG